MIANTQTVQSGRPVGAPGMRVSWYVAYTLQPTTATAGTIARPRRRRDHVRRGNVAKNANSSGPTAELTPTAGQRSHAKAGGRARQNTAIRMGNTTDSVAMEANNRAPSRADGCVERLTATRIAKPSVMTWASRNVIKPGTQARQLREVVGGERKLHRQVAAVALDPQLERCGRIQVHADPLPVHAPFNGLPVGPRDTIADAQVRGGGRRSRMYVAKDHRPRFEPRDESEWGDPQEIAGEQECEIPDVRCGEQADGPQHGGPDGGGCRRRRAAREQQADLFGTL